MQRRKQPRLPVECLATVAGYRAQQDALVTDLSLDGLRVTSDHPVPRGTPLLLRLSLPDERAEALEVQLAHVQWVHDKTIGLKIMIISPSNKARLSRFLQHPPQESPPQGPGLGQGQGPGAGPGPGPGMEPPSLASTLQLKVSDVLLFVNWMNEAHKAFQNHRPLPPAPFLESPQVNAWAELVQKSGEQLRLSEERRVSLLTHVGEQEAQVERLVHQLHDSIASLYDNLGQKEKAEQIRKLSSALQIIRS